jgi:CRISPR system Cascade subunit CasA
MVDLMAPASNLEAPLQIPSAADAANDLVLVARALVRGQGKTEGYHERRIPAPRKIARMLGSKSEAQRIAEAARLRVREAGIMAWNVLRPALMALFENGPERDALDLRNKDAERKARSFLDAFEQFVDRSFFPDLWAELEEESAECRAVTHRAWMHKLLAHAETLLRAADERVGRSTQRRYRARVRAQAILHGSARANPALRDYFQRGTDAD